MTTQENKPANITIVLSEQDLSEFLEGNEAYMSAYADQLQKRAAAYYEAAAVTVDISANALTDTFDIDGEGDDGTIAHIMNEMVNDWDWLPDGLD